MIYFDKDCLDEVRDLTLSSNETIEAVNRTVKGLATTQGKLSRAIETFTQKTDIDRDAFHQAIDFIKAIFVKDKMLDEQPTIRESIIQINSTLTKISIFLERQEKLLNYL